MCDNHYCEDKLKVERTQRETRHDTPVIGVMASEGKSWEDSVGDDVLYNKCNIRLVGDGSVVPIDNQSALPHLPYQHAILKTLHTLGLEYTKSDFNVQVEATWQNLQLLVELTHWADIYQFHISVYFTCTHMLWIKK
jgi:hypothetical protein